MRCVVVPKTASTALPPVSSGSSSASSIRMGASRARNPSCNARTACSVASDGSASPVENDHVAVQAAPVTSVSSARSRAASPSTCSRRKRRSSARCASRKRASETVSATVLHLREDALVVRSLSTYVVIGPEASRSSSCSRSRPTSTRRPQGSSSSYTPSETSIAPMPDNVVAVPATLMQGAALAARIREQVAADVAAFGPVGLATVLAGDDPASHVYVTRKHDAARAAGIASVDHRLPANVEQEELLALLEELNADEGVDGILVQLPLPDHIDQGLVLSAVDPAKDVDGFH